MRWPCARFTASTTLYVVPDNTVIVIDDAEHFYDLAPEKFIEELYGVAKHGAETKQYTAFVIVHNPVLALRLHAINGHRKVKMVRPAGGSTFALPPKECRELASSLAQAHRIPKERIETFKNDAAIAQTPGSAAENAAAYASTRELAPALHECALEAQATWQNWLTSASKWKE